MLKQVQHDNFFIKALVKRQTMKFFENYELKKHTTFKIGGKARKVWFPESIDEFCELLKTVKNPIVLGNCSNVLISSQGVDSDVIITTSMKNFSVEKNIITAECGVKAPMLARAAQEAGLSGFEFMIFPGSVGGVVYMNASAHNQFVSDTCVEAEVFDIETGKILNLNKKELNFSYRHSILQEKKYILLRAKFEMKIGEKEAVTALMERNTAFRKDKQPNLAQPNAGSVFKNPENDSAGRLLEKAGAKGLAEGSACVWHGHANFIVNNGGASSRDVSNLMNKMYNIVKEKYRIELTPEIEYIGTPEKDEKVIWDTMLKRK